MNPSPEPPPADGARVIARVELHPDGTPRGFILRAGAETAALVPGHSWTQVDHFKWVTRGLIEPPQSFHVHADGSVDLNGESFSPGDPAAAEAFTRLLNARHVAKVTPRAAPPRREVNPTAARGVVYHVRLDPYGHLLIRAQRGTEQTETGMRGLAHLATEGWTRPFQSLHVDPLQRFVELNGHRFEPTAEGATALEAFLTAECAPPRSASGADSVVVRENPASSTGFDIAFHVTRAGARAEIHGHLNQETLDALQDAGHSDLLQPGVVLRLAPPFLYFRRRRPDGGESTIPEIGDVKYRSTTAQQLQHLLNHPAIRRGGGVALDAAGSPASPDSTMPAPSSPPLPPPAAVASPPTPAPRRDAPTSTAPKPPPLPPTPPKSADEPTPFPAPFTETRDPHLIHEAVFRALAEASGHAVQDLRLSLDRIFHDRRFEVVSFDDAEISSVLQLRAASFHGVYLVHLAHERLDLVMAHHGVHFEWGTDRCLVQPSAGAESAEYPQSALLGLARQPGGGWAFVVTPRFREWSKRFEPACREAEIRILDPYEFATEGHTLERLWPPPARALS